MPACREHRVDDLLQPHQAALSIARGVQFERFEHVDDAGQEGVPDRVLAAARAQILGAPVQRTDEIDLMGRKRFIVLRVDLETLVRVSLQRDGQTKNMFIPLASNEKGPLGRSACDTPLCH